MSDCIFCKIASKEIFSHVVAEDEKHIAFLSIFPSVKGNTVVIPKAHYSSCIYDQEDEVVLELMRFTRHVARKIDSYFGIDRTAVVFEGYGVNHLHAKLIPLHGTKKGEWVKIESKLKHYMVEYCGYIVSADGLRESDDSLSELARGIYEH
jgi:histidine triad (HIT) family protein